MVSSPLPAATAIARSARPRPANAGSKRAEQELLPTGYFHVVFTLPHQLAPLALQNKREIYGLLFRASAETLLEVARDPQHLGAEIGFFSVLHTWGQNCCITRMSTAWFRPAACRRTTPVGSHSPQLLPARESPQPRLPRQVRRRPARTAPPANSLSRRAATIWRTPQRSPPSPPAVPRRLGGLLPNAPSAAPSMCSATWAATPTAWRFPTTGWCHCDDGRVTFRWRDSAHKNKKRLMHLPVDEFLRRFLLHALPRGFVRIRHFGFFAHRRRATLLPLCFQLLA